MNNVVKYTITALWLGGLAVSCYAVGVVTGKAVTYAYCKLTLPIMNKIL